MTENLSSNAHAPQPDHTLANSGVEPGLLQRATLWLEGRTELEQQKLLADIEVGDQMLLDAEYSTDLHAIEWWRARAQRKATKFLGRATLQAERAEHYGEQNGKVNKLLGTVCRGLARYSRWRARNNETVIPLYDQQLEDLERSRYLD